jgi:hypothetical protein
VQQSSKEVPEAVTRLGLRAVDLVVDEQSYLLHCLNTAGHKVKSNMSCREETNTSLVRSSRTVSSLLTVQKPTRVEWHEAGLVDLPRHCM